MDRKNFLRLAALAPMSLALRPLNILFDHNNQPIHPENNTHNVVFYNAETEKYNALKNGFNKRINKKPATIALCYNEQGVAEAIKYAIKNNLAIAVKSGGHCMEGFSSNNNGLVINLSPMRNIKWLNKDTISVNPACTLKEIYEAILPQKKIIPGGSCAGVGIGGLVLAGGYGLLARKFGLTCDSLQSIKMVDGTGNIHTASSGSELLWACKGGNSGNFGVATELVFKVHNAPSFMTSYRFKSFKLTTEKSKLILKQWFELSSLLNENCFSAFVQNGRTCYILLTNVGAHDANIQRFINGLKAITETFTTSAKRNLADALKVYYGQTNPLYFKNASAGLYKNFQEIETCIDRVLDVVLSTPGMIYQVNTLGRNIQNPQFEKTSSFPYRDYPYFSELQTYWEKPDQEKQYLTRFEEIQAIFLKNGNRAQYRNYPDINFADAPEIYYGKNYKRLQSIKQQYDPQNIFRYEQSIRPL